MKIFASVLLVTSLAHFLLVNTADARTLTVPDPYPTIQTAIDSAAAMDTVLVSPGLYEENLDTQEKWLVLKSVAGAEATVIDGGQIASVIRMPAGGLIEGLTIQHGQAEFGGGVVVGRNTPEMVSGAISDCVILENRAGSVVDVGAGGGIYLYGNVEHFEIHMNSIVDNYAGQTGGGIFDNGLYTNIANNWIHRNGCHVAGGGIRLGSTILLNNIISENWSDYTSGGVKGGGSEIRNNTIVFNYHYNGIRAVAGISITDTRPIVANNIVALNHGPPGRNTGIGLGCGDSSPFGVPRLECNDVWGNDGGDYYFPQTAPCDSADGHNISLDPLFCDPENGNYSLQAGSPCSEEANPTCGQIGAFGVACSGTAVERATWGRLKQMFDEKN